MSVDEMIEFQGVLTKRSSLRLKLYIHDYLMKNNFPAAAQQFNLEAGLGEQRAPINVPEGLLHE